jgi:hypothetical protein
MSSDSAPMQFPNILANHVTCQKFCGLYEECLSTLADSFPECKVTPAELERYRTQVKGKEPDEIAMIKTWHQGMIPLYERADRQDDAIWDSLPLLGTLNISQKIKADGFSKEDAKVLWEYVEEMNHHSRIYNAIPQNMLNKIQTAAVECIGKVQRGEMKLDLENLNWDEVKNVGQSLMESVNPQDLEEFTGNITGLAQSLKINNLQDVFKLVGEVPGVSEAMANNSHLVGLLEQVLQNDSTRELMQNVDKMMNGGFNGGGNGGNGGSSN